MLFENAFNDYLTYKKTVGQTTSTIRNYSYQYKKYFVPAFSDVAVEDINSNYIIDIFQKWEQIGLNVQKMHTLRKILKAFFNYLVFRGYISSNPVKIKVEKYIVRRRMLSREKITYMLKKAEGEWFYPYLLLVTSTGIRHGEMQNLKWADVDFATPSIYISQGKSQSAIRTILITRKLADILNLKKKTSTSEWVFTNQKNGRMSQAVFGRVLRGFLAEIGLEQVHVHSFRHAHTTFLIDEGMPTGAIAERLGWASPAMLHSTYGHVTIKQRATVVRCVDEFY